MPLVVVDVNPPSPSFCSQYDQPGIGVFTGGQCRHYDGVCRLGFDIASGQQDRSVLRPLTCRAAEFEAADANKVRLLRKQIADMVPRHVAQELAWKLGAAEATIAAAATGHKTALRDYLEDGQ